MEEYVYELLDLIEESPKTIRFTSKTSDFDTYLIHLHFDETIHAVAFQDGTFGLSPVQEEVDQFPPSGKVFESWEALEKELEQLLFDE